jgi:hypothetical protein
MLAILTRMRPCSSNSLFSCHNSGTSRRYRRATHKQNAPRFDVVKGPNLFDRPVIEFARPVPDKKGFDCFSPLEKIPNDCARGCRGDDAGTKLRTGCEMQSACLTARPMATLCPIMHTEPLATSTRLTIDERQALRIGISPKHNFSRIVFAKRQ